MLRALDIPYLALNPGASYRGLHDSIVNYLGNTRPQMLLCLHEESAVSIAQGYAKASGKMMGAVLHSNVGLMHATMSIFNAWCDRVPMLIRDYTKWDNQPASVPAAYEALMRAVQIAGTAPRGPTYVNLDAALQEAKIGPLPPLPEVARFRAPDAVMPAPHLVEAAAAFPTDHPLHAAAPGTFLSSAAAQALRQADVVLSLDWIDLAGTLKQAWGAEPVGAKMIQVSADAHNHRGWSMDYQGLPPADVYLMCEPDAAVPLLFEAVKARPAPAPARRRDASAGR